MKQIKCKQKSTGDMIIIKVVYEPDFGEYSVIVTVNGQWEDKYTYFTDCREDAVATQHSQYHWFRNN